MMPANSRKPLMVMFVLLLAVSVGAERQRGEQPLREFPLPTLQGQVTVESFGQVIAVAVDVFDSETLPDGFADRVFLFETSNTFEPIDLAGMAFVEPLKSSLTVRFADRPALVLQLAGGPAADSAAVVIGGGVGYLETSRYRGEKLDQVAAIARADDAHVLARSPRGALESIRGADQAAPIEPVQPPSCSTSCSTTCGDGSTCTITCTKNCGSCSCGTGGASCSCS